MPDKKDRKIPEAPWVENPTGEEKIPVSTPSGEPGYVEVNQIASPIDLEYIDNQFFTPPQGLNNDLYLISCNRNRQATVVKTIKEIIVNLTTKEANDVVVASKVAPALIWHYDTYRDALLAKEGLESYDLDLEIVTEIR